MRRVCQESRTRHRGRYALIGRYAALCADDDRCRMTPPQVATAQFLPFLPNGHQVVLPGFGHQATVFREQPEAGSRLINTFFDSGQVDDSLYVPASVDFTPPMTFGAIAKSALVVTLALAALTVLSLLVMARLVRTRGRIGPKSGALLRSVYPLVLGLGGWFLGALIVLTTMPGVRIDNKLLIILSVGVPIGLGAYWAMGASRLVGPEQACRTRGGGRRRARRRLVGVPRHGRPVGSSHRDRRGPRRRQPHVDPARHIASPIHPEWVHRNYDDGGCA
jgi:hypothetical protein